MVDYYKLERKVKMTNIQNVVKTEVSKIGKATKPSKFLEKEAKKIKESLFDNKSSNSSGNILSQVTQKANQAIEHANKRIENVKSNTNTDLINGNVVQGVIQNVDIAAKNTSILNEVTDVIDEKNSIFGTVRAAEGAAGYNISNYVETEDMLVLTGDKPGENSRLYLNNKDGSSRGIIDLDITDTISSIKYENGQIIVQTATGEQRAYSIERLNASLALAQKYEGTNTGKYYATDGEKVVDVAKSLIGILYDWGGAGEDGRGYDCSGLVAYAWTGVHSRTLPNGQNAFTGTYMGWPQTNNPQPGDICVSSCHTGIYIGDGQMIHAPQAGETIKIGPVQSDMIYVKYDGG